MGGGSHVVIYKLPRQWTTILIFDVVGLAFFLEKSEANVNLSWYNYQYASDIMHAKNVEFTDRYYASATKYIFDVFLFCILFNGFVLLFS